MKTSKLAYALFLTILLSACGNQEPKTADTPPTQPEKSVGTATGTGLGFSKLSNGKGGWNYEPNEITTAMRPDYDRDKSIEAFKGTLYKHLLNSGCQGCHSSQGLGQAPLHADGDVSLAHDYAITRTNFAAPNNSRLVVRQRIERHGCLLENDKNNCAKAGRSMLAAIEDWKALIEDMIPERTRIVPEGETISAGEIEAWIETDKATLRPDDKEFIKYTSMHEMHNSGATADELEVYRVGLSKALNSVARWAPEIKNPIDVNGKGILYKFDTRWYWGYNKGVKRILFGGSDDDMAFGREGKMGVDGKQVPANVQSQTYGYTKNITKDDNLAKLVWERILHGNVEGAKFGGNIPPYIDGFKATKMSRNAAGDYVKPEDLKWVETAQLVYTVTRPDVYNAIMMIPMHSQQLEAELGIIKNDGNGGLDTWDIVSTWEAITIDSRLLFRGETESGGWYWKSWDVFTGQIEEGDNVSIYDVYKKYPDSIRFPWWANPIPKFIGAGFFGPVRASDYSFIASLAQPFNSVPPGCDPQFNFGGAQFKNCRHYTGTDGLQQAASEIIWDLPNGLQGYMLTGAFNQRRVDAFINIVRDPRIILDADDTIGSSIQFSYGKTSGRRGGANDPRLNTGSSCIGCHVNGMNRIGNDSGDWARMEKEKPGSSPWPKGKYGIDAWANDGKTLDKIIELYPPSETIEAYNEEARAQFLTALTQIKNGMMLSKDKNIFVEPVIAIVEFAQGKYKYPQTTSN